MFGLSSLARRVGGTRWFAAIGRAVVPVDRLVGVLTKGRVVTFNLKEIPCLMLTTTGRRSGRRHTTPVLYVRDGNAFVVVGSNWGQAHHPAWSHNLLAHPDAVVTLGGKDYPVRAQLTEGAERERLFELLRATWPAFTAYEQRSRRRLRVFRLEPVAD